MRITKRKQDRSEKMDAVCDTYAVMMYGVAFRILGNDADAEDAVATALEKIFKNIDKISGINCPQTKGYIVTIIRNTSIDIYNRRKRRQTVELELVRGLSSGAAGSGELARCLDSLPEREKRILILRYHYGYTEAEAAKIMGLSVEAAKKLRQRAKAKLEVQCKEEGLL